jgi:hypothetical protein
MGAIPARDPDCTPDSHRSGRVGDADPLLVIADALPRLTQTAQE